MDNLIILSFFCGSLWIIHLLSRSDLSFCSFLFIHSFLIHSPFLDFSSFLHPSAALWITILLSSFHPHACSWKPASPSLFLCALIYLPLLSASYSIFRRITAWMSLLQVREYKQTNGSRREMHVKMDLFLFTAVNLKLPLRTSDSQSQIVNIKLQIFLQSRISHEQYFALFITCWCM